MNNVEDELFTDFCSQINVQNIRQYEEKELRAQQERAKRRLEFENQRSKLVNQLEYERSRDTEGIMFYLNYWSSIQWESYGKHTGASFQEEKLKTKTVLYLGWTILSRGIP